MSAARWLRALLVLLGVAGGARGAAAQSVVVTDAPSGVHIGRSAPVRALITERTWQIGCGPYDYSCEYWSARPLGGFGFVVDGVERGAYFGQQQIDYQCTGDGTDCLTTYELASGGVPLPVGGTTVSMQARQYYVVGYQGYDITPGEPPPALQSVGGDTTGLADARPARRREEWGYYTVVSGVHTVQNFRRCAPWIAWDRWPGQSPDHFSGSYNQRRGDFNFRFYSWDLDDGALCSDQTRVDRASLRFHVAVENTATSYDALATFQSVAADGSSAAGTNILLYPAARNAFWAYMEVVRPDGVRIAATNNWSAMNNSAQPCRPEITSAQMPPPTTTAAAGPFAYGYRFVDPNNGQVCTDGVFPQFATFNLNGADRTSSLTYTPTGASGNAERLAWGATNQAYFWVQGRDAAGSTQVASRTDHFSIVRPGAPTVALDHARSGATFDRALCLKVALRPDVAADCGDLRIVHPLPTTRTFNTARTPALVYYANHAHAAKTVAATVTLAPGALPERVEARLVVNGTQRERATWPGTAWAGGGPRRVAIVYDAGADGTWRYAYSLEVAAFYAGEAQARTTTETGEFVLVNRAPSPYGAGWWVDGLEWIQTLPDQRMLWVGGDGSTQIYRTLGGGVWAGAQLTGPDTLKWDAARGRYLRLLSAGARVEYDAAGRHVATVNRLGHTTRFTYKTVAGGAAALDSIVLPTAGGPAVGYRFDYDGVGRLYTVTAPRPDPATARTVTLTTINGAVQRIQDPDGHAVGFGYAAPGRLARHTDRRGTATDFGFHWARSLAWARTQVGDGRTVQHAMESDDERVVWPAPGRGPLRPADVFTRLDGPRDDADHTDLWLDGYGAPMRVLDPLRRETVAERGDTRFPGLVTMTRNPAGLVTRASYDARGNLERQTVENPYADGRGDAVTRYRWDPTWDQLTWIDPPLHDSTTFGVDPATGDRLWQQDARGDSTRVTFRYDPHTRQVQAVTVPGRGTEGYGYDWFTGNVTSVRSRRGIETRYQHDGAGQLTLTTSPIDSVTSTPPPTPYNPEPKPGLRERRLLALTEYEVNGLVRAEETRPESVNGEAVQAARVAYTYDEEGNRRTATRTTTPDPAGVGALVTQWGYDGLGRVVREVEPGGAAATTTEYDHARGRTTVTTRRGLRVTTETDVLGRVSARVTSPPTDSAWFGVIATHREITPRTGADTIWRTPYRRLPWALPEERAIFTYDPATGALRTAHNRDATVTRSYYPNGQLRAETQAVQTLARNDSTAHPYTVAYEYDLNGRRTAVTYPWQLGAAGVSTARYGYHAQSGALVDVRDPQGTPFAFGHDAAGSQTSMTNVVGDVETRAYDPDGNLLLHHVRDRDGVLQRNAAMRYDLAGRVLRYANRATAPGAPRDTLETVYSPLGHVVSSTSRWAGVRLSQGYGGSHIEPGNTVTTRTFALDALGNLLQESGRSMVNYGNGRGWQVGQYYNGTSYSRVNTGYHYESPGTGRLTRTAWRATDYAQDQRLHHDADGNVVFSWHPPPVGLDEPGTPALSERASTYAADGKLRFADARTMLRPYSRTPFLTRNLEEFRYDALGRRVLVHTRRWCSDLNSAHMDAYAYPECGTSVVRRVVWDGADELGEIRMPESQAENDTGIVQLRNRQPGGVAFEDPHPFFGRVAYTHAGTTDQPLSVVRMGYAEESIGTPGNYQPYTRQDWQGAFSILPSWNARGQPDGRGTWGHPAALQNGRLPRVMFQQGWEAYPRWEGEKAIVWHGSLLEDKRDLSGTMYRRNRHYDPVTSRFTQEDPIGLAGGLNLYGYANGDPVNLSDPFGLCPPIQSCLALAGVGGGSIAAGVGGGGGSIFAGALSGAVAGAPVGLIGAGLAIWAGQPVRPVQVGRVIPGARAATDATVVNVPLMTTRAGDLPARGKPNSSAAKDDGQGNGQIRDYGKDGRAKTDYDFGHNHGAGDPHAHDWDWSKTPPRQPGRPIRPGETPP